MNIIVLLLIQNNYCLKQSKNELLANRTSKNADVLRWLIEAVFTRIFWLFVLFSSVTLVIWTLLLNFFFAAEKKNCQGSVWRGVPFTAKHNNTLHDIDIATRDQRMKNSGAFHGLDHPSYPVKYNSVRNYFNSCLPVNFRTKGWGNRLAQRRATPEATDHPCASNKETLNITALFFSTPSQRFSPSSF